MVIEGAKSNRFALSCLLKYKLRIPLLRDEAIPEMGKRFASLPLAINKIIQTYANSKNTKK
jgi:hypothetical protein